MASNSHYKLDFSVHYYPLKICFKSVYMNNGTFLFCVHYITFNKYSIFRWDLFFVCPQSRDVSHFINTDIELWILLIFLPFRNQMKFKSVGSSLVTAVYICCFGTFHHQILYAGVTGRLRVLFDLGRIL